MVRIAKGDYSWIGVRVRSCSQPLIRDRYETFVKYYLGHFVDEFYYPAVFGDNGKEKPIIPYALFVKTIPNPELLQEWKESDSRIYYYYMFPGDTKIALISDNEIDILQKSVEKNKKYWFHNFCKIEEGDKIKVISGPLIGLEGEVIKVDEKKNKCYFVSYAGLKYVPCITIDLDYVVLNNE